MKPVKTIRRASGLVEAICKHGVGHPIYGSVDWMRKVTDQDSWDIHGCDGCCGSDEWQISTLRTSVEIANQIILDHKQRIDKLQSPVAVCAYCGVEDWFECCEDCSAKLAKEFAEEDKHDR